MIKRMESEHIRIGRISEDEVVLTVNGADHLLTVDELQELTEITRCFWDHNSLWNCTSEAKAEHEHRDMVRSLTMKIPTQTGF